MNPQIKGALKSLDGVLQGRDLIVVLHLFQLHLFDLYLFHGAYSAM